LNGREEEGGQVGISLQEKGSERRRGEPLVLRVIPREGKEKGPDQLLDKGFDGISQEELKERDWETLKKREKRGGTC